MDICLQVLKESNKSRFDSYSVRNSVLNISHITRRGSRINTDRFPKWARKAPAFSGVRGVAPLRNYLDFYSLKSPFLDFQVIQMGYWPDFNLQSVFILINIFNMKNVTDFRKTVETGVDPHLITFRDCHMHIFSDNLSRNSCIWQYLPAFPRGNTLCIDYLIRHF